MTGGRGIWTAIWIRCETSKLLRRRGFGFSNFVSEFLSRSRPTSWPRLLKSPVNFRTVNRLEMAVIFQRSFSFVTSVHYYRIYVIFFFFFDESTKLQRISLFFKINIRLSYYIFFFVDLRLLTWLWILTLNVLVVCKSRWNDEKTFILFLWRFVFFF